MAKNGQPAFMAEYDGYDDRGSPAIRIRLDVLVAVWTVPALLACFQRWAYGGLSGSHSSLWRIAATEFPGWYLWAAMTPAIFFVAARFPLNRRLRATSLGAHGIAFVACLLLQSTMRTVLSRLVDTGPFTDSFARGVGLSAVSWLPSTFLLYVATVGVALWMRSIEREKMRAREGAAMTVQLARAELNALRSQIQPHFLFNTLNTIAILIRERETEVSARLVTQLGDILRHLIHGSSAHETALDDEIAILSTYLEIEQVRFGDRLEVRWIIPDDLLNAAVPALVLQPLVENALRHGIAKVTKRGVVEIGARRELDSLVLWIADNGPGVSANTGDLTNGTESDRVGLINTRERLARLYPNRSSLRLLPNVGGGTRAEMRLPFHAWTTAVEAVA